MGKRELVFLLLFTCSFVVSVSWRFLFLLVLGMGCAFLLWHSLDLPLIILDKNYTFNINHCFLTITVVIRHRAELVSAISMNCFEAKMVNITILPELHILGENIFIHCSPITVAHVDIIIFV